MMDKLTTAIIDWMNKGEHIILVINLNKYIITSEEAQSLHEISLTNTITDRHYS